MSRIHRPPLSLASLVRHMKQEGRQDKIAVVVGTFSPLFYLNTCNCNGVYNIIRLTKEQNPILLLFWLSI